CRRKNQRGVHSSRQVHADDVSPGGDLSEFEVSARGFRSERLDVPRGAKSGGGHEFHLRAIDKLTGYRCHRPTDPIVIHEIEVADLTGTWISNLRDGSQAITSQVGGRKYRHVVGPRRKTRYLIPALL